MMLRYSWLAKFRCGASVIFYTSSGDWDVAWGEAEGMSEYGVAWLANRV